MRIVNLRTYRGPYLYCGRLVRFHKHMGRLDESPLGNPFRVKDHGADCLRLYREWLFERIRKEDPHIIFLLREAITEQSILGCWCTDLEGEAIFRQPEVCHTQVIAKAYRWLQKS